MISRDARDFNIPCLEACFCGLSLCFYIFHFAWTGTFVNEPPPPPQTTKKTKVLQSVMLLLNLSVSSFLSISLSLFLALSLAQFFILYCFLLKSYCSLNLGVSIFSIIFLSFTLLIILFCFCLHLLFCVLSMSLFQFVLSHSVSLFRIISLQQPLSVVI